MRPKTSSYALTSSLKKPNKLSDSESSDYDEAEGPQKVLKRKLRHQIKKRRQVIEQIMRLNLEHKNQIQDHEQFKKLIGYSKSPAMKTNGEKFNLC